MNKNKYSLYSLVASLFSRAPISIISWFLVVGLNSFQFQCNKLHPLVTLRKTFFIFMFKLEEFVN